MVGSCSHGPYPPRYCHSMVSAAVIKHWSKQGGEERVYSSCRLQFIIEGSQGKNLRQEPKAETNRETQLTGLFSCFAYATEASVSRGSTVHSGMGPPTSINNKENAQKHTSRATIILEFPR